MSMLLHSVWNNIYILIQGLQMKAGTQPLELYCFYTACVLMCVSAWLDARTRRFPNECFVILLLCGLCYSYYQGHILASLTFFITTTVLGIFLFPVFHIRAGDAKFLSILFFFVNMDFNHSKELLLFFKVLFIGMALIGFIILLIHYKNPIRIYKQAKRDLFAVGLALTGQSKLVTQMLDAPKEEITIPLVSEFVCLYFIFIFLLAQGGV